jgi:DNA polymerase
MRLLFLDLETASPIDIKTAGAHRYAEPASILLFSYAWDNGPVEVVDRANGEDMPLDVMFALGDPAILKVAHNAAFERAILTSVYGRQHPAEQWLCTAAWAAYAGLPRGLGQAAMRTGVPSKAAGIRLIKRFCGAEPPTGGFAGPEWEEFKAYNRQDVETERALYHWLKAYPMPPREWDIWAADQEINDRGVLVDRQLVQQAIALASEYKARLMEEAGRLTGLENPNSVKQLKEWLELPEDQSLNKAAVVSLLKKSDDATVTRVLEIRQSLAKSSVGKWQALNRMVCRDGRIRGTLMYYGASTGRWSGRGIQPQNFPSASLGEHEDDAREMLKAGQFDLLELCHGDPAQVLSRLLRTAFIAPPGKRLRVDDYRQIEARVAAWLAGETWILDTFRKGLPYYETTASKLYQVPLAAVSKDLRQKGKAAALALQYGGWTGALQRVGGITLPEEQQIDICKRWRAACPAIVAYWAVLGDATVAAVANKSTVRAGRVTARYGVGGCLYLDLPSGRSLIYREPRVVAGKKGDPLVEYTAPDGTRVQMWAGLITENACQALARDVLAEHLLRCRSTCVLHVHDEVVLEGPKVEFVSPEWADGLPLDAAGFDTPYYRKE